VLPCFTGGEPIALGGLGQPAVINLWASWCAPCRKELPEFQKFADAHGDRVLVLGVDTFDTRTAGASAGSGFGAHYPNLFDPDKKLQQAVNAPGLPMTIFLDAHGSVKHTDATGALTAEKLSALATQYLGVTL
jgi:thiol-disulfide isomerase/thioredoxin